MFLLGNFFCGGFLKCRHPQVVSSSTKFFLNTSPSSSILPFFSHIPGSTETNDHFRRATTRRFGTGKVVVSHDKFEENPWLTTSDLAVAGRPVSQDDGSQGAPTVKLPRGQELLLAECGSADSDLRMSERIKPSPEQAAAQKGVLRAEKLLMSLLKNVNLKGPAIICNFTGYVEEFGVAVTMAAYSLSSFV